MRSWDKMFEGKVRFIEYSKWKTIRKWKGDTEMLMCHFILNFWPRKQQFDQEISHHKVHLPSRSLPRQVTFLSCRVIFYAENSLTKCCFHRFVELVYSHQENVNKRSFAGGLYKKGLRGTFPPTFWPTPTEEICLIPDEQTVLLKHKADGESMRWGDAPGEILNPPKSERRTCCCTAHYELEPPSSQECFTLNHSQSGGFLFTAKGKKHLLQHHWLCLHANMFPPT